jgi:Arc/MetJ-type ribon-helix-helix transcriptional regulator
MKCPPIDTVTLYASLGRIDDPEEKIDAHWSALQIQEHLADCPRCDEQVRSWKQSLEQWEEVDLLDQKSFGEDYFRSLQEDIEEAVWSDAGNSRSETIHSNVVELEGRRRSRQQLVVALSALAAILLFGWLGLRDSTLESDIPAVALESEPTDDTLGDIESEGRALGRTLLASLAAESLDEESDSVTPVWSTGDFGATNESDLSYFFSTNLYDELDDLGANEAAELIERL